MSGDRYASVPERITWTTGFRLPIDKHVLGVLSTFANFRTGKHADMYLDTLVTRAKIPRATLSRSLQRLKEDEWIFATVRHRRPTVYDINVDKLATHWMEAKLVDSLRPTGETQELDLRPMGETQDAISLRPTGERLRPMGETQEPVLRPTGETPRSPVLEDPLSDHKEPALRAVPPDHGDRPTTPVLGSEEAKVEEAKPPARGPHQLTFGPEDVSAARARDPNWRQRLADTIREALRKHG